MDLRGSVASFGTCRDEKQLDRAHSLHVPTQTLHDQTQFPGTYIFIGKKLKKPTQRLTTKLPSNPRNMAKPEIIIPKDECLPQNQEVLARTLGLNAHFNSTVFRFTLFLDGLWPFFTT